MKRHSAPTLGLLLAFVLGREAIADDYPFEGIYVDAGSQEIESPERVAKLQLKCGLAFNVFRRDGSFELYFLDAETFLNEAKVSYIKSAEGRCSFDRQNKLEKCNSSFHYDGKINQVPASFNHYSEITPLHLRTDFFDSLESFGTWKAKGTPKPLGSSVLYRCLDISTSAIAGYLSSEPNKLSQEETFRMSYFGTEPSAGAYELSKRVLAKLRDSN
jgi:hypothetical protein